IATSSLFNSFIMFIIGINAIVIGLETSISLKKVYGETFSLLDDLFLAIYTAEFLIKVCADYRGYWKSAYNIFDFVIIAVSFIQILMSSLDVGNNSLGVFRLLRALRTLRTISFVEGLQVLVTALIDTIRNSVLNVVFLLALLMMFFGVAGYYIFGYDEDGDRERWGTLNNAMLTLFTFVTADGWTDIQRRLEEKYPGSQWFTVVFLFLGHFIFTNLFIGIIIMNIHEATEKFLQAQRFEKEAQLSLKKEYLYKRQHEDVRQMLEKQKTSHYTNFNEMASSFVKTLRHDDYVIMKDVCTNLLWIETYIDSLDYLDLYMHRVQQGHRNFALVLAEMAERNYKKQYGLLLTDDHNDRYEPFLKKEDNIKTPIPQLPAFTVTNASEEMMGSSSQHAVNPSRPSSVVNPMAEFTSFGSWGASGSSRSSGVSNLDGEGTPSYVVRRFTAPSSRRASETPSLDGGEGPSDYTSTHRRSSGDPSGEEGSSRRASLDEDQNSNQRMKYPQRQSLTIHTNRLLSSPVMEGSGGNRKIDDIQEEDEENDQPRPQKQTKSSKDNALQPGMKLFRFHSQDHRDEESDDSDCDTPILEDCPEEGDVQENTRPKTVQARRIEVVPRASMNDEEDV
uniref:Ion transport domain-containing protein n=2 Tax=Clytia hemisphaerica TaxID=252671 RepID=A0A7M5X154_9CNID